EVISAIVHKEPPRLRSHNERVPRDLELVCQTAMARRLADRYASAGALRDALHRLLAHQAIHARAIPLAVRARRFLARHRTATAGAGLCAAVIAGVELVSREARLPAPRRALDAAPAGRELAELPISRLVELRDAARTLRGSFGLGGGDAERLRRFDAALLGVRTAWLAPAEGPSGA